MNRATKSIIFILSLVVAPLVVMGCAGTDKKQSTGQYVDDATITSKVKTQLFKDPGVSGFQVDVDTFKGQVQLSGFVDTADQKARAAEIAKGVGGVKSVSNNIIVKTPKSTK